MNLFHERPFYTAPKGVEQLLDTRLYRPAVAIPGSQALDEFDDTTRQVLNRAGFTDADTTLLSPDKYEVTIVSKGSINHAVTGSKDRSLRNIDEQFIDELLFRELLRKSPDSIKQPIPAILDRVGIYGSKLDASKKVRYLTLFPRVSAENMKLWVIRERRIGYDVLRRLSGMDKDFAEKRDMPKYAAVRIAAFHDPNHRPSKELIASLMPTQQLMNVILGEVQAGPFKD